MDTQPNLLPASLGAVLRQLLTFAGGILVSRGLVSADQAPELVGAVLTVAGIAWSLVQKRRASKALAAAIAAPAGLAR